MWDHAQELVDEAVAVPVDEVADAVRLLASRARVVAEGAGALAARRSAVAATPATGRVVCIVSGGNIDADVLAADPASVLAEARELGEEAVDLVDGVVVDEADPHRVLAGTGSFSRRPSEYQLSCAHTP